MTPSGCCCGEGSKRVQRGQTGKGDLLVAQGTTVFELLAGEDETLLIGGDALLVLDLGLDIIDGVRGLNLEGDSLSGEGLNEDLHAEMWGRSLEEVAVVDREG